MNTGVTFTVTNPTGFDLIVSGGSTLTLNPAATWAVSPLQVNGGTLNTNIDLSYPVASDFQLTGNGR